MENLYASVREILVNARKKAYSAVNFGDTLRPELSWSHYRRLISVEDEKARLWYMNEAADSVWSTRQMDRQISTLYYERLLASREKESVVAEAEEKQRIYLLSPVPTSAVRHRTLSGPIVFKLLRIDACGTLEVTAEIVE